MTQKTKEKVLNRKVCDKIVQGTLNISSGFFLLGLEMGTYSSTKDGAVRWVKHNFGDNDFLMRILNRGLKAEVLCSKCGSDNSLGSKFCSECGGKLDG